MNCGQHQEAYKKELNIIKVDLTSENQLLFNLVNKEEKPQDNLWKHRKNI